MNHLNFRWVIDGKLGGHQAPSSEQDLDWLKEQGILSVVRMAETHMAMVSGVQVAESGLLDCHEPVPDFHVPEPAQIDRLIAFITASLAAGRPVGVSCKAGMGRTGTILACYLVSTGLDPEAAIKKVRSKRPGSIETTGREEAVRAYAARIRDGKA